MPRTARRLSGGSAGTPGFSSALIEVARHVWREPRRDTTEVTAGDCVSICICQSFDTGSGRVSLSAWPGRPSRNTARTHVTALCQRLGVNLQRPKQILQGPRRCRSSCTTWQLHFRGTVGRCGKGGAPESATALLAHKGAPISATQPGRNGTRAASTSVYVGPASRTGGFFDGRPRISPAEDMSRFGEAAEAAPERFSVLCNELSGSSVLSILICLSLAQHSAVRSHCTARGARAASGVT